MLHDIICCFPWKKQAWTCELIPMKIFSLCYIFFPFYSMKERKKSVLSNAFIAKYLEYRQKKSSKQNHPEQNQLPEKWENILPGSSRWLCAEKQRSVQKRKEKNPHISLSRIDKHTGNGVERINDLKPQDLQSRPWGNRGGGRWGTSQVKCWTPKVCRHRGAIYSRLVLLSSKLNVSWVLAPNVAG